MNRGPGILRILTLTLVLALCRMTSPLYSQEKTGGVPSLLEAPTPYFHTYNLTSLFPVSAALVRADTAMGRVMTLQNCLDAALSGNPDHLKSHENLRTVTGQILLAWGNYMPTLRASYGLSQSNRTSSYLDPSGVLRTSGGISKSTYANLNAGLTLFDAASHYFDMKNARFLKKQRLSQLSSSELNLVDQVRRAYINALRQEQLLIAAKEQAESRKDQLKLAQARFSVGSVTKLDVLQAQVDLNDQQLVIIQYENALKNAKMDLNRLMGGDLNRDYGLVDEFKIQDLSLDVDGLVTEAVKSHPDVKSMEYQIRQLEGELWMGRLAYLPTVGTSLSYSRNEDGLEFFPNRDKGRGLGFSLSWNIWDAFGRFSRNRQTEVSLNNLNYDFTSLKLDIERDIRENYIDLLRLQQRHQALNESRDLRRQSLELEQERYRLGAASILDLRQAQVDYSQAEVNYINSIYDFHTGLSTLTKNVGRELF
ncbi:MAG: hypothetical protein A3F83_04905 [Candidatus Glassbacteria bacterium RIFCSPLOWO2_12_FULL_58_11]|uniref:Transporter n=2 Tax=Candidatus Glassiibacteriota TaxID=1817805 RepID=A0A1F5Z0P3_9BACT|nr:MAG: hypothetical protein A3F83_04905 [Candidatus Glassbacteria bacterium RIFCSPLOWO2_12_FULL_58_11]